MGKPVGIALGVVGAKPLPAEVMVAHAKALEVAAVQCEVKAPETVVADVPVVVEAVQPKTSRKRRRARDQEGQFMADDPATPADEAWVVDDDGAADEGDGEAAGEG